ncbi:hypothetical protein D3C85_1468640 [compost metagenome]
MAPKSSTIAKAAKKIFKDAGTCLPSKATIANAKAISVAIGIPHPEAVSYPLLSEK